MITVKRGNVVLQVADESADKYMGLGYDVIDEKGKVVRACIPNDLGTLQKHFVESNAKIAKLEAEIAELKSPKKETKKAKTEKVEAE